LKTPGQAHHPDPAALIQSDKLLISTLATLNYVIIKGTLGFAGFDTDFLLALHHDYLHHSIWNMLPRRVRRLTHSRKWDVCQAPINVRPLPTNVDDVT